MSSRTYYIITIILFSVYFLNGIIAIPKLSVTGDEGDHMNYAMRFAKMHPDKVKPFDDASAMPMSVFNAIPRAAEQIINPSLKKTDWGNSDIFSGRYMTLLICSLIGFFILKCSTELYGRKAGLFSLFLFVFCPNLNGHAVLVTTDAYSALFTLTSAWYFRKALLDMSWKNTALFGLHLGLAQLAKQSLTHLYIIFFLLLLFYLFKKDSFHLQLKKVIVKSFFVMMVVVLIINVGFLFRGTGMSLNQYHFRSSFFTGVQDKFSFIGSLPLPLPEPYLSGLDLTKNIDEMGLGKPESAGRAYLLGEYKSGSGFWYYYFVVLFFKTPVAVIILFILFLLSFKKDRKHFFENEFIFLAVIVYFLIYFNFFYNSQVGIRHIIMIFPLLYVILGKIAGTLLKKRAFALSLGLYSLITFYYFFPNLIAYTNEFVLPKRNAYKVMSDSNIDYGQGYFFALQYIENHPGTRFADSIPVAGKQLVRVNSYLDLNSSHMFEWLRKFKPLRQVGHSYLLFDIKREDIGEK